MHLLVIDFGLAHIASQTLICPFLYPPTCTTLGLTRAHNHIKWVDSTSTQGAQPRVLSDTPTECVTQCELCLRPTCSQPNTSRINTYQPPWNKHQTPYKPCTKQDTWHDTPLLKTVKLHPRVTLFLSQLYHKTARVRLHWKLLVQKDSISPKF